MKRSAATTDLEFTEADEKADSQINHEEIHNRGCCQGSGLRIKMRPAAGAQALPVNTSIPEA